MAVRRKARFGLQPVAWVALVIPPPKEEPLTPTLVESDDDDDAAGQFIGHTTLPTIWKAARLHGERNLKAASCRLQRLEVQIEAKPTVGPLNIMDTPLFQ